MYGMLLMRGEVWGVENSDVWSGSGGGLMKAVRLVNGLLGGGVKGESWC